MGNRNLGREKLLASSVNLRESIDYWQSTNMPQEIYPNKAYTRQYEVVFWRLYFGSLNSFFPSLHKIVLSRHSGAFNFECHVTRKRQYQSTSILASLNCLNIVWQWDPHAFYRCEFNAFSLCFLGIFQAPLNTSLIIKTVPFKSSPFGPWTSKYVKKCAWILPDFSTIQDGVAK